MPNSQYYTTYSTKRYPFVGNQNQRSGSSSVDQRFINFFASEVKDLEGPKYYLEQRGGLVYKQSTTTGLGRGAYYWNNATFSVVGNTLYKDGTPLQVLSTAVGSVGFQEFANGVNQQFLVVLDGTSGWVIKTDFTVTKITSANFPSPHVVHAGYMDGYIFVAKPGTADLYNCNLEDPTLWTAGDFISAETFPDPIVAVCRQNNYIVAIGTQTTEFFYDTGVFPGTPLARNAAALHQVGTSAPDTVVESEEQVVFVGQSQTGGRTVVVFDSFNPKDISTEVIRQSLDAEGTAITNAKAFIVRTKGHKFYVLNLTNVSWVYDFDSNMWHQWADYTGSTKFNCDYACDAPNGAPVLLDRTSGYVYVMTEGVSKDATSPTTTANITSIAISDKHDFGSMNRKFMSRFVLVCDTPYGNNQTTYQLSWTDDDYQTYTTPRTINLSNTMTSTTQLGMFRRRAFKIVYSDAYPLRIEGFEVDINAGSQ